MSDILDAILHIDQTLDSIIKSYGALTYAILFAVVFAETGLVVTPFLPGDSLLFAAGAIAASPGNPMHPLALAGVFVAAAACGDTVNYWVGRKIGPRILRSETSRLLSRKHLDRTHAFFDRYGGLAIPLARFLPIIRTFMPFTAGVGGMPFGRFLAFGLIGSTAWVGVFVGGGYLFGSIPVVRNNFALVVLGIIAVSVIPAAVGAYRGWRSARNDGKRPSESPRQDTESA
jgi:membrane-associated protein